MDARKLYLPTLAMPPELVYENPHQKVYRVDLQFRTFSKEIFVTHYGDRVGIVVESAHGILLTRQYRYLIGQLSWEIPGGRVEAGESAVAAAQRECLEETGVLCEELEPLLLFHPGLETLYNPSQLFYASKHRQTTVAVKNDEVSGVEWLPLERCVSMIRSKTIVDSLSVIALLSYRTFVKTA